MSYVFKRIKYNVLFFGALPRQPAACHTFHIASFLVCGLNLTRPQFSFILYYDEILRKEFFLWRIVSLLGFYLLLTIFV